MKKNGFTLVELMITVAIIAILSTVGISLYNTAQKSARDGKRRADMEEIQKALEQYYSINQKYPGSNGDAGIYPTAVNSFFTKNVTPDDGTGSAMLSPYKYFSCPTQNRYLLCKGFESCSGRCTETVYPTNGCGYPGTAAANKVIYCISNISTN